MYNRYVKNVNMFETLPVSQIARSVQYVTIICCSIISKRNIRLFLQTSAEINQCHVNTAGILQLSILRSVGFLLTEVNISREKNAPLSFTSVTLHSLCEVSSERNFCFKMLKTCPGESKKYNVRYPLRLLSFEIDFKNESFLFILSLFVSLLFGNPSTFMLQTGYMHCL